jgi:hypothetical protein
LCYKFLTNSRKFGHTIKKQFTIDLDKSFCCVRPGFAASVVTVLANLVAINEKSFLG